MFKLFKRKASINSVTIPDIGWNISKDERGIKQWINPEQTIALSINFFELKPDLPSLTDLEGLRDFYRKQIVEANGGLIQVDLITINGFEVLKTIFKIRDEGKITTYLTSLTIPFESCSYVIKIQAPEIGVTGFRESITLDKLMKEGVISTTDDELVGWTKDPYSADWKEGNLMNLADQEKYDQEFPKHPLSISRKLITQIEAEISFAEELQKLNKFKK